MAESEFQRKLYRVDSRQSFESFCGVCSSVVYYFSYFFWKWSYEHTLTSYGLPVNFQAILIQPNKKSTKRLREVLNQLYIHLDNSALQSGQDVSFNSFAFDTFLIFLNNFLIFIWTQSVDIPGLSVLGQSEYYPYVYYKINIDMIDIGGKN